MITAHSDENSSRWTGLALNHGPGVLCAAAGFLSAFTVSLVGQMPLGELILLCVFPWALLRAIKLRGWTARLQQMGWFRLSLFLIAVTIFGYVISDLYRATSTTNLLRGWARVGFLAIDLVAIAYLIDNSWGRFQAFVLSLFAGYVCNAVIYGPLYGEWWQFGVGYAITLVAAFVCGGRGTVIQLVVLAGLGILNLALGARSLGGICLLAAGLFSLRHARGALRPPAIALSAAAVVALFLTAGSTVTESQDHQASNVERQSMLETAGEMFLESPLIGQGSWFIQSDLLGRLEEKRNLIDPTFKTYSEEEARQLSIHSQLLVALSEAGILGGAFFMGLVILLIKTLRALTLDAVPRRAFVLLIVSLALWNVFMSPFSGVARIEIVLAICACLLVILQRQGELSEEFHE